MTDLDFEGYLRLLTRLLRLSRGQREEIRRELRGHLEEAIEDARRRGLSREQAIARVLDDFGDAAELAARFSEIGRKRRWIMRGTVAAACLGFAAVSMNFFSPQIAPARAGAQAEVRGGGVKLRGEEMGRSPADEAIRERLLAPGDVRFEDTPMAEALEWFRTQLGVNMVVQWKAIEDEGVPRDRTVTLSLKGLPLGRVLQFVLDACGEPESKIEFDVQDGVLIVGTRETLRQHRTVEVYDVRDLLEAVRQSSGGSAAGGSSARRAVLSAATGHGSPGGSGGGMVPGAMPGGGLVTGNAPAGGGPGQAGGTGMAGGRGEMVAGRVPSKPDGESADEGVQSAEQELMDVLCESIDPSAWTMNGGTSTMKGYHGTLIVRTHTRAHAELKRVLAELNATLVNRPK